MVASLDENRRIITQVFDQLGILARALNPDARVIVELDADTYNALSAAQGFGFSPGTAAEHSIAVICGVQVKASPTNARATLGEPQVVTSTAPHTLTTVATAPEIVEVPGSMVFYPAPDHHEDDPAFASWTGKR